MKLVELVMLARVMSQKYGVNVQISPSGKTASCNSRPSKLVAGQREFTITLPCLKDKGKFDRMIRGYLDHELGHVQYTDFDFEEDMAKQPSKHWGSYYKRLWNIFEDVYIEQRMGATFPGSKLNLQWLARNIFTPEMAFDSVKEIVDEWRAGTCSLSGTINLFVMPYCLFKRRALVDPALAHSHTLFDSVRNALAKIDLDIAKAFAEIDKVLAQPANSSRETAELARRVWYALDNMQLNQQQQTPQQGQSGQGSGGDQQHGDSEEQQGQCGNSPSGAPDQDDSDSQSEQGSNGNDQQQSGNTQGKSNDATQDMMSAVVDAADGAFEKNKDGTFKHRKRVPLQTEVAAALSEMIKDGRNGAEQEDSYGDSFIGMRRAMRELGRLRDVEYPFGPDRSVSRDMLNQIAMLQSGFMRTIPGVLQSIQFSPRKVGYIGRMSGRDLYKTGTGNGRIFQRKAERMEQRVDVAILLDASGSMCMDIYTAQITLYAMLGMLKRLPKVRSYAAIFSDENYAVLSRFADKRVAGYSILAAHGSTPTAGAVMRVLPELSIGRDVRRILFIITDGEPDEPDAFVQAIKIAHAQNVEVYGISIGRMVSAMYNHFGTENVIKADDVKELPLKLAGMMKNALVKAVAA